MNKQNEKNRSWIQKVARRANEFGRQVPENIQVEAEVYDDFVDTFNLDQKEVGETIKDVNGKKYTFMGSGTFDNSKDYKVNENAWIDDGILDKEITYEDDEYQYIITLAPFKVD